MSWNKKPTSGGGSGETHNHENLSTLNKLNEYNGSLTFDGAIVNGGAGGGTSTSSEIQSSTANRKPTVVFIMDDTAKVHYDNMNVFMDRGYRYTTGLRMDFISPTFTYDMVREMQSNGFEIAYHGKQHDGMTPSILEADINTFLAEAQQENINIEGFIGPSGTWDENIVFHKFFNRFKWGRGAGGSNGVANIGSAVDYFKQIKATSFIDDLTSDAALTTAKAKIDQLATRGTGVLTLSMHMTTSHVPHLAGLLDYITTKNVSVMTLSEAYEIYGAILEFYDSSLVLGDDFTKRGDGNGGTTINPASPHFILQKDGTIISNKVPVKMVTPVYKNSVINGNTTPDSFEIGVTMIQYGSADDRAGFPNIGTLYNFNLGKNTGQQFQLFKAHNKGGIYFREADTTGAWKTTMEKLGVFRTTKPSSPTSTGEQGDFSADANYLYICYGTNTWIRVPKDSTWV